MKINKSDLKLYKKEYQKIIEIMNTDTFLTYDKNNYQCADCHEIFLRGLSRCPVCGNHGGNRMTKGKTRYDLRTAVQTFRKVGNNVIELVFLFSDSQKNGFNRVIELIRKSEYKNDLKVMLHNNLGFNSQLRTFAMWYSYYYGRKEGWHYDKPSNVRAFTLGWDRVSINKDVLFQHPLLNRVYSSLGYEEFEILHNRHYELAFKYPYLLEMLNKRSKRGNLYYGLPSINRYKNTYIKYHGYFERLGRFNPKLLMKLNKVPGMIKYDMFERLDSFREIPKEIKTKKQLEMYSNIIKKSYGRYQFDEYSYKDYLRMALDRGLDVKSEEVLFNSKWVLLHDQWAQEANLKKELKKEKKFVKVYTNYPDELINGFHIEAPHSIKDLFNESAHLKHCIRTYANRIIEGQSLILFIRNEPGEPFITAEVIDGKITQLRGSRNKTHMILPEHKKALNKYISNLSLNGRKETAYNV